MSFILNKINLLRNHWKKTLVFSGIAYYGGIYFYDKYLINELMRDYCKEAAKYGDVTINLMAPQKKIIILMNPTANRRKSQKTFEKYCEPILHLAGLNVEIVKTDSEGHARRYMEDLKSLPDAVLVAGGDGTLSETVTGLLRRSENETCPVGILPLGQINSIGKTLFFENISSSRVNNVRELANSAIAVVRGKYENKDVMKIEVLADYGDIPGKPIYAIGSLQWGAFRDAMALKDKYWYTGSLRNYSSILFNAFGNKLTWNCDSKISYTPPCNGCSNCYKKVETKSNAKQNNRWFSRFIPKSRVSEINFNNQSDYSKIINENCSKSVNLEISPYEFLVKTNNLDKNSDNEENLEICLMRDNVSSFEFINESWKRLREKSQISKNYENTLKVRTIQILPKNYFIEQENEVYYSIDNEAYEVKPIQITLIPKAVKMFTL